MSDLQELPNWRKITSDYSQRPETGPMVFGDDWPGVFIRGDSAGYYAYTLNNVLDHIEKNLSSEIDIFSIPMLRGLAETLSSSHARNHYPQVTEEEE